MGRTIQKNRKRQGSSVSWISGLMMTIGILSSCGANVVSEICKPLIKVAVQDTTGTKSGSSSSGSTLDPESAAQQAETDAEAAVATARKKIKDDYVANYVQTALSFNRRPTVDPNNVNNTVTTFTTEFRGIVPSDALTAVSSAFFDMCFIYVGNVKAFACSDLATIITFTSDTSKHTTTMEFSLNAATISSSTRLTAVFAIGNDANIGTPLTTLINDIRTGLLKVSVIFVSSQIAPISGQDLGGRIVYRLFGESQSASTALTTLEF